MRLARLALILGLPLAFLLGGKPVQALTIVPPSVEYSVNPGDVIRETIKLFNGSTTTERVYASTANFSARGENGDPDFDFTSVVGGTSTWIDLPPGLLSIAPNDSLRIPYTITVPKDAEPGGHYAAIFFGNEPAPQLESGQVAIQNLLGSLVILRVNGEVKEGARVVSFAPTGGKKSVSSLPVSVDLRIENTGNVHVRPEGTITIKNMFGRKTASVVINDVRGAVLPDSIRNFSSTWQKETAKLEEKGFFKTVSHQWNNFALGTYTITAAATYGSGNPLAATTKVTVFPWQLLLVELMIVVAVLLILIIGIRRYNSMIIGRVSAQPPKRR